MPEPADRQYRPGDVADGYVLTTEGGWVPLPVTDTRHPDYQPAAPIGAGPPLVPNTAAPRKSHKVRNALLIVGLVLAAMVACGVAVAGQAGNDLDDLERATQAPSFGTDPATAEPAPAKPAEPAFHEPTVADYALVVNVTDKQCFGSAGCNIEFTVGVTYTNPAPVDPDVTYALTYEVTGGDAFIGTMELRGDVVTQDGYQAISTESDVELVATPTSVTGRS